MLLGARQFFERRGKSAPTARDYVQNGLIAMWDGIENAGWGIHDPNATIWKDLTGGDADWALLTNIGTSGAFEVGSDYVKILKGVGYTQYGASSYGGNGHCAPSWSGPSDIKTIEIVIDNSDFDLSSGTTSRIISFGVASGNIDQTIHVNGPSIATNAYNKYTQVAMVRGLNSYSTIIGSQPVFLNGKKVLSVNRTFGGYVYGPPVLGAYAGAAAVGMKIKSIRIYGRELTDAERRSNWAVDNARFNSAGLPLSDVDSYAGFSEAWSFWDGIRNVGMSAPHDNSASTWCDLARNDTSLAIAQSMSFGDKGLNTVYGEGVQFGGVNASNYFHGLGDLTDVTVECVIDMQELAPEPGNAGGMIGLQLALGSAITYGAPWGVKYYVWSAGQGNYSFNASSIIHTGLMSFVCVFSATEGQARLYIDNTLRFTTSLTSSSRWPASQEAHAARFNRPYSGYGATGTYNRMSVLKRVLTDAELTQNWQIDQVRFGGDS